MRLTRSDRRVLRQLAPQIGEIGERLVPERWWARSDFVTGVASVSSFGSLTVLAILNEDGSPAQRP